jgi:hypothetical protein
MTVIKHCTHCGKEKPLKEFSKDHRRPNGRSSWCKSCKNAANREHRDKKEKQFRYTVTRFECQELNDPVWLEQKYLKDLLSPEEIANLLGCSIGTVDRARRQHGIQPITWALRKALRIRHEQQRAQT